MLNPEKFKSYLKQSSNSLLDRRYHYLQNNLANKALKEIEKDRGILDTKLKKTANAYAIETLGWKGYSPWLYVYSAIKGSFKEGWIPDNYYGKVVIPTIQGDYGKISFLKPLCNRILKEEVSPEIASFINGFWFDKNLKPIARQLLKKLIFSNNEKIVCKLDQSYQGRGVFLLKQNTFDLDLLEKKGNCVLQKYIEQHPFFNEFMSHSVATIRLTTVVDNENRISLRAGYVRFGRANETHVQSSNHIRVPLGLRNGTFYAEGYLPDWKTSTVHPDSGVSFSHKTIPQYNECVQLAIKLHGQLPMVRSIGWDFTIDKENRPVLMEWNGYSNDIKFSEATQGPCFKDLNWHLLNKS
ncbi:hypothetical protein D9O36_07100 [Zobellia amurskyensis]|uniref:Alpha-L-glutamate ligase-related protein ATP-grasp domain-containing protein n=1 Tax=Zobellia amurskyensis TaxID=248905 RepID=A0A7X3D1M3_9FLAO|nr:sugar-transfer associated ATP-grasp domain-containing protein [Zobellia amurskyensis]MUH35601.1 hypothetical protein [Zobellia amurskyensis]